MPTPREAILAALHARLSALSATALRGDALPERVPSAGLVILRDGEPGEPEVTLSPLRYHYQHRAEIEAVVQGVARDAVFDTLSASIGAALAADRTLGGLCDWVEADPFCVKRPVSEGRIALPTPFETKRKKPPMGAHGRIQHLNVAEGVYQIPNSLHADSMQQTRNKLMWRTNAGITTRFLIRDADTQF